jgi:hypothetical protein
VNSREHHYGVKNWEETQRRQMRMSSYGIVVLPVTPFRIRHDSLAVATEIRAAIKRYRDRPRPNVLIGRPAQPSSL